MNLRHMLRYKNRYVMFDALNAAFFHNELPRIPIEYDNTLSAVNAAARILIPKNDNGDIIPVLLISENPKVYLDSIEAYAQLVAHELCHFYSYLCGVKDIDLIEKPDIWQLNFQRRYGAFQYHNKEFYASAYQNGLASTEKLIEEYACLIEHMKKGFPGKFDDVFLDQKTFETLSEKIGFNSCIDVNMDILNGYLPNGKKE